MKMKCPGWVTVSSIATGALVASPAPCLPVVYLDRHRLRIIGTQKPAHQAQHEVVGRHVSEVVIQAVEAWSLGADEEPFARMSW